MKENQTKPNEKPASGTRQMRIRRLFLAVIGFFVLSAGSAWHLMLPARPESVPGNLTAQDRKVVAQLCRHHTVRFGLEKLRQGEVGWFVKSTRVLFKQKINRFSSNGDGTYAIHTVVYDPKQPDGFYVWWRHQVTKTNGHWTILRSY
jgi:hypothetical protein